MRLLGQRRSKQSDAGNFRGIQSEGVREWHPVMIGCTSLACRADGVEGGVGCAHSPLGSKMRDRIQGDVIVTVLVDHQLMEVGITTSFLTEAEAEADASAGDPPLSVTRSEALSVFLVSCRTFKA
jgi:hypothetical protein